MDVAKQTHADIDRSPHDNARRGAFEANLTGNLQDALGETGHPDARRAMVRALGEAHEKVSHLIEARAAFGSEGRRWYGVLQFGAVGRSGDDEETGPMATRVFGRVDPQTLADLANDERRVVADCVERAEIRNFHPLDWRPRIWLRSTQVYLNLLAGRDRRSGESRPTDERRAPNNETMGALVISIIALVFACAGVWMIGAALIGLVEILSDPKALGLFSDIFWS